MGFSSLIDGEMYSKTVSVEDYCTLCETTEDHHSNVNFEQCNNVKSYNYVPAINHEGDLGIACNTQVDIMQCVVEDFAPTSYAVCCLSFLPIHMLCLTLCLSNVQELSRTGSTCSQETCSLYIPASDVGSQKLDQSQDS